jgi:peptidoglycan/LPS O-acetylase OafA/YrhL
MNLYAIVLLNFILKPGEFIVSEPIDRLLLWVGFQLSLLSLLYLTVATFKYWLHRQGAVGRELGRLSYGAYILHVVVLGALASLLAATGLGGLAKYLILAAAAWAASNLLTYGYSRVRGAIAARA